MKRKKDKIVLYTALGIFKILFTLGVFVLIILVLIKFIWG